MTTETVLRNEGQRGERMPIGLMAVAVLVTVVGAIASFRILTVGHPSFNVSSALPWGLPVAAYIFFVLTSTGLTFVASVAMVFQVKEFYPLAKRCVWLAIATLIAGFLSLAMELGHPFRLLWAVPLNMQIRSPMFWMGAFYLLYLVFLVLKFSFLQRRDWHSPASRATGMASFITVIIAHATLGLIFGMMAMRPYWYGAYVPLYFLATAALSGVAFAIFFTHLAHSLGLDSATQRMRRLMVDVMPRVFALTLGVVLIFTIVQVITGLWTNNPDVASVMWYKLGTPWFHVMFWLGLVVPFVMLLNPGIRVQPGMQSLAALLVIIGLFIGRMEFVVGGQQVPVFKGTWYPDLLTYTPSLTEWGVVILAAGIGLLIYAYGAWRLQLDDIPADAG